MTESNHVVPKAECATQHSCFRPSAGTRCTRVVVVSELMRFIHHNQPQNSNLAADGQGCGNETTKQLLVIHMVPKLHVQPFTAVSGLLAITTGTRVVVLSELMSSSTTTTEESPPQNSNLAANVQHMDCYGLILESVGQIT